jgi:hypothetical protein
MTPTSCPPAPRNRWWCAPTGRCEGSGRRFRVRFPHDRTDLGPKTGATPSAGSYSAWFCTLTARNGLDILASQWSMSPVRGKTGSAVGLKSLSVENISIGNCTNIAPVRSKPFAGATGEPFVRHLAGQSNSTIWPMTWAKRKTWRKSIHSSSPKRSR